MNEKTVEKMWKVQDDESGMESILSSSLPGIEETAWKDDTYYRPTREESSS